MRAAGSDLGLGNLDLGFEDRNVGPWSRHQESLVGMSWRVTFFRSPTRDLAWAITSWPPARMLTGSYSAMRRTNWANSAGTGSKWSGQVAGLRGQASQTLACGSHSAGQR